MRLGSSMRRRRRATRRRSGGRSGGGPGLRFWGLCALAVGVGLVAGWVVSTRMLFPAPPPPGDLYEVPEVRGTDLETTLERLSEAGLALGGVERLRHPELDSGLVAGQAPLPGQLASPSSTVEVTLSLGPERREVPDVVDLREDWARNVLEATGFEVVLDSVEDELPPGRVVALDPEPGTELALPGEVTLTVSLGPPTVTMPLVLGLPEEEARDTLEALGLEVDEVEEVFRFGRDRGVVVEQTPPADSVVERGSPVRLSVGRRGRAPVAVRGNNDPRKP